jgi:hypothetical protein
MIVGFGRVLRMAQELGLAVEEQEIGLRLYDVDGRLLGSQLTREQAEVFVMGRLNERAREDHQAVANTGCAFPPF